MLTTFDMAIVNAVRQVIGGCGVVFLLAFLMWIMSQRRRGLGGGFLGNAYYCLVAPGVMFHECGHALGCLLTFTKVSRFVPFHPKGDRLGYVAYAMPVGARLSALRVFIISTSPVWLGCMTICLLGWIMGGSNFFPRYSAAFPHGTPAAFEYAAAVFFSSLGMFQRFVCVWNWTSPTYLALLYLLFCITSEITLSPSDFAGMWRGAFILMLFIVLLNIMPGVNRLAFKLSDLCAPALFIVHTSLLFVLIMDIAFYVVFKAMLFPFRRH